MRHIQYIGSFPPPYGGVTVKNSLIYTELSKIFSMKRNIGESKASCQLKDIRDILFSKIPLVIGVSARRGKSEVITRLFYIFNRKTMSHSVYFMMGGVEAGRIASNRNLIRMYSNYAKVYVETETMKKSLEDVGMVNISLFPNCRKKPQTVCPIKYNFNERLSCVFFSNIQRLKGVDIVLDAANKLPNVDFFFYGRIDDEIKEEFGSRCNASENVFYKGIFDGENNDVYQQMGVYDLLLFPTQWRSEGVPGVLVEGKIAGLAEIVSDVCYNAELVKNGVEGVVLNENVADCLAKEINFFDIDREYLHKLKEGSRKSAERFYIENYIDEIVEAIDC